MALCPECGKESQGSNFCPYCGAQMGAAQPEGRVPGPGPAPPAGIPAQPATVSYPQPPRTVPGQAMQKTAPQSSGAVVFGIIGVASMIVAAAGSLLPWLTFSGGFYTFSISSGGWNHDGKITVFIAAIALAFFLVGLAGRARWPFVVGMILSLVVAGIMVYDIFDIVTTSIGSVSLSFSNVGYGLIMGAVAGAIGVVAGIGGIAAKRA